MNPIGRRSTGILKELAYGGDAAAARPVDQHRHALCGCARSFVFSRITYEARSDAVKSRLTTP